MLTRQLHLPGGVLTLTVQHAPAFSLIVGFLPAGEPETEERYGGCDLIGAQLLLAALGAGRDAFVHDHGSGEMHARLIWDAYGATLTLRAAGERQDIPLDEVGQETLRTFLLQVLHLEVALT